MGSDSPGILSSIELITHRCEPHSIHSGLLAPRTWPSKSDLKAQSTLTWLAATAALGALGHPSKESTTALLLQLDFSSPVLRSSAARGLGKAGLSTRRVRRILKKKIWTDGAEVAEAALIALKELGYDVTPLLRRLIAEGNEAEANVAIRILGQIAAQKTQTRVTKLSAEL